MPDPAMVAAAQAAALAALEPQPDLVGLDGDNPRAAALRAKRERAGRPPGARNRRSEEIAAYLVEHIGDPLVMLTQLAMMPAAELAAAASCKPIEALAEKRLAAIAVLPYLHRRQPLAVDLTNHRVVHLHLEAPGGTAAPGAPEPEAMTIIGQVVDIVENQEVSDAADPAV